MIRSAAALAPGRVAMALGAGFTGRYALGQKPLRWADVEQYVVALRSLLRGETVEWEGAPIRMLHTDGFVADRPIDVELLIGSNGPKGTAVAGRLGAGLFVAGHNAQATGTYQALLQFGTVLDEGEDVRSPRCSTPPATRWRCSSTRCTSAAAPRRSPPYRAARPGSRPSRRSRPPNATSSRTKATSSA